MKDKLFFYLLSILISNVYFTTFVCAQEDFDADLNVSNESMYESVYDAPMIANSDYTDEASQYQNYDYDYSHDGPNSSESYFEETPTNSLLEHLDYGSVGTEGEGSENYNSLDKENSFEESFNTSDRSLIPDINTSVNTYEDY